MAVDKLVDSAALDAGLTTVANAIRIKGGTSAQLSFPQGMAEAIEAIPSGGENWIEDEIEISSYKSYETISSEFISDLSPTTRGLSYLYFENNTSKTRAAVKIILFVYTQTEPVLVSAFSGARVWRVGGSNQPQNYGVDVYAGAVVKRKYMTIMEEF